MKMFYISFGCCCCCCRSQIKDRFFVRFEIDIKTNWMLMLFGWTGFFLLCLSMSISESNNECDEKYSKFQFYVF